MGVVVKINRDTEAYLRSLGASNSSEMRATAQVLKRSIRKVLGVPGKGKPSKPGEPPRKQKGDLQKSVKDGPIGDVRRVAVTDHTAPLMQFGVDTRADAANPRSRRNLFTGQAIEVKRASRRAQARRQERRSAGGSDKVVHEKIDQRPFMEKAYEAVEDEMADVLVNAMQQRAPNTTL